jgi:hypothetical protein
LTLVVWPSQCDTALYIVVLPERQLLSSQSALSSRQLAACVFRIADCGLRI